MGNISGEKMKIQGDTIIFKSDDENYYKEKDGIKPNTVRFVYQKEEILLMVNFYNECKEEIKYIEIHNRTSPHLYFRRRIRDITWYGDRFVYIISWFHEEDGICKGYNAPIRKWEITDKS